MHVFFVEDGLMEKGVFLATWKDISNENEKQFDIHTSHSDPGQLLQCIFDKRRQQQGLVYRASFEIFASANYNYFVSRMRGNFSKTND